MKRIVFLALISATTFCFSASKAPATVYKTLDKIPTIEGNSVLARMKICGIVVQKDSWVEVLPLDNDRSGDKKGDVMVWAFINVPAPESWSSDQESKLHDLNAAWRLRDGKYIPVTGWANKITTKAYPMDWLRC